MCEILIFVGNRTHADPVMDRHDWKRGMPVEVKPDGFQWGREEVWPTFALLKLPGVPVAKAQAFLEEQGEDDAGNPYYETIPEMNPQRRIYRLRAHHLKWADLPLAVRNEIQATGEYTTTVAAIRNYLRRIRDDAQFTGLD